MESATAPHPCQPQHTPDEGKEMTDDETGENFRRYCCKHCKQWLGDRAPLAAY